MTTKGQDYRNTPFLQVYGPPTSLARIAEIHCVVPLSAVGAVCIVLLVKNKKNGNADMKRNTEWIRCPVCGNKTRDRIREDTVLKNYPLYCPKCKQETLIKVKSLQVIVIKEPDA